MTTDFTGDLEGYLKWAEENFDFNTASWCPRHWAPCPVLRKNGLAASAKVMVEVTKLMPAEIVISGDTYQMNQWVWGHLPLCCELGDEKIAEIWDEC